MENHPLSFKAYSQLFFRWFIPDCRRSFKSPDHFVLWIRLLYRHWALRAIFIFGADKNTHYSYTNDLLKNGSSISLSRKRLSKGVLIMRSRPKPEVKYKLPLSLERHWASFHKWHMLDTKFLFWRDKAGLKYFLWLFHICRSKCPCWESKITLLLPI